MTLARAKPARQNRSRSTRDRLLAAGHRLLARHGWDALSVTAIAAAADCSVGSFYARYDNKEAFFEALCADFLDRRRIAIERLWQELDPEADLAAAVVTNVLDSILPEQNLWRAALTRSALEPEFWTAFREAGLRLFQGIVRFEERRLGRRLEEAEERRIRFAQLLLNGYINNGVMVRPGPFPFDDNEARGELIRAFRLVAAFPDR